MALGQTFNEFLLHRQFLLLHQQFLRNHCRRANHFYGINPFRQAADIHRDIGRTGCCQELFNGLPVKIYDPDREGFRSIFHEQVDYAMGRVGTDAQGQVIEIEYDSFGISGLTVQVHLLQPVIVVPCQGLFVDEAVVRGGRTMPFGRHRADRSKVYIVTAAFDVE